MYIHENNIFSIYDKCSFCKLTTLYFHLENKGSDTRGVNFDTLGSWNNRLVLPVLYDESIKKGKIIPKIPIDEVGVGSVLGRRKDNEDRYVIGDQC